MTDLMDTLYQYAEEKLMRGLLDQEEAYAQACHAAEKGEKTLRAQLSEEQQELLEALLEERKLMAFCEWEALFRAGFQVAMELARS